MGKTLNEVAQELKDSTKKVHLIYAFNGTGKTRLSREFRAIVSPKSDEETGEFEHMNILYYNAFTEDLFYWDNDLKNDRLPKLLIQPNIFTEWIFNIQGKERTVIDYFQKYTNKKLSPKFNDKYTFVTFSYRFGDTHNEDNIKISKGEESNLVWCTFYAVLQEVIANLEDGNEVKTKYVFIDDPVTSLDDNHLIHLAVDLAQIIKKAAEFDIKFYITTHSTLFYNILLSEFNVDADKRENAAGEKIHYRGKKHFLKYVFIKQEDGTFSLEEQSNQLPFSYHIHLIKEIEKAKNDNSIKKYHFNFLRNLYEKTASFLGYENYTKLLPTSSDGRFDKYSNRIINAYSHSKNSEDEITILSPEDIEGFINLYNHLMDNYKFWKEE